MNILFEGLNSPQLQSVKTLEGPLMILAGAGSGKTRVLTRRLANLVANGTPDYKIIAVTFTNKAASEMKERVASLLGGRHHVWIGTFHSISARLLRMYPTQVGLSAKFTIYDAGDQKQLIKRIMKDTGLNIDAAILKETIGLIDKYRSGRINKLFYPNDRIYKTYVETLEESDAVDFTGLLEKVLLLKDILPDLWDYVLVDEFQDTNNLQFQFMKLMVKKTNNICVVGDDDQSIYSWRGANPDYLLRFEKEFSGTTVIRLEQNYRSTGNIINSASKLISHNKKRKVKTIWTDAPQGDPLNVKQVFLDREEAWYVVNKIKKLKRQYGFENIAILYRLNAQSRIFEEDLRRNNIPYRIIGGLRFYERAEIKDLLSYLRVLINPDSENDILRIINTPKRGIGKTTVEKLRNASMQSGNSLWETLKNAESIVSKTVALKISDFMRFMLYLQEDENLTPSKIIEHILIETKSLGFAGKDDIESAGRLENIQQLVESILEFENLNPEGNLKEYLDDISLLTSEDEATTDKAVTLMTIHSAKGLEFDVVFLPGWEDGIFPMRRNGEANIEEERRLAYVAVTRARREVYISYAKERRLYGNVPQMMKPSPFLTELPFECIKLDKAEPKKQNNYEKSVFKNKNKYKNKNNYTENYSDSAKSSYVKKNYSLKSSKSQDNQSKFAIGDVVKHKIFGKGRVKAIAGQGKMQKAIVDFNGNTKVILVSYIEKA